MKYLNRTGVLGLALMLASAPPVAFAGPAGRSNAPAVDQDNTWASGKTQTFSGPVVMTGTVTIPAASITAVEIATDGVGAAEIAAGAVGTSEIATDGVAAAEIAADAVGTSEIATDGVGTAEIASGAVLTDEIGADTIAAGDIAAGGVATSEILDATILQADVSRVFGTGTAPGVSSCGTSPPAAVGSDMAFSFTMGTADPTACTLSFATTFTNTPSCFVQTSDIAFPSSITAASATAITVTVTATGDSSSKVFYVGCIGRDAD